MPSDTSKTADNRPHALKMAIKIGQSQTTVWPESTPETRAAIGCFGKEVGNYAECWCGYHVVECYGCCPECQGMLRGRLLFEGEAESNG